MSQRSLTFAVLTAILAGGLLSPSRAQDRHALVERYRGQGVSPIIFPAQDIPLEFSHERHLARDKLGCDFCHEDAADSKSSLDNNIPREEQCSICHEIDRTQPDKQVAAGEPRADCESCHPGFKARGGQVARVIIPAPNLKFNHKAHLDQKIRCQFCHGDLLAEKVGLATRDQLPRMRLCLGCHNDKEAPARCTTCHLADAGGVVKTQYEQGALAPSGVLRGDAHDLNFRMDHSRVAKDDERYCASCHKKEFCVGCHNGTVKPMDFHANDYVSLHAIDARRNNPDCSACHRLQTFCVGCHSRSGVALDDRGSQFVGPFNTRHDQDGGAVGDLTRRFHPPGWVENGAQPGLGPGRSASHHTFEAQRNIKQCASCHREQFCLECHSAERNATSVNAFNFSPHGPAWRNSRRCQALLARAGRMCLRCHVDVSQARCDYCADPLADPVTCRR